MSQKVVQTEGRTFNWTNGTGTAVTSGQVFMIGTVPVMAVGAIANGATGVVMAAPSPIVNITVTPGTSVTVGAKIYRVISSAGATAAFKETTAGSTVNLVGYALQAIADTTATDIPVKLAAA